VRTNGKTNRRNVQQRAGINAPSTLFIYLTTPELTIDQCFPKIKYKYNPYDSYNDMVKKLFGPEVVKGITERK
jgi:hypothetical protein